MAQYPPSQSAYPPPYQGYTDKQPSFNPAYLPTGGDGHPMAGIASAPSAPGGYPPATGGYPPTSGGYPPPSGGYPPSSGGYPPPSGGYPPSSGGYPPPSGGYPPSSGGYPPASGYPPPSANYPPPSGGYPPSSGGYPPPSAGYPPSSGGYPPTQGYTQPQPFPTGQQPGYPPQGYQHGFNAPGGYPPPGGVGAPISQQPTASGDGWMSIPQQHMSCPPGLEYLTTLDQLLIKQKVEILEALTGFETQNKYTVKNSLGQKVFYAVEDSSCCGRCCFGPLRSFDMKILDNFKNEVIHMSRPLACQSCFFPCCLQKLEVFSPPGRLVGTVEQEWTILSPKFSIKNAAGDTVLYIEGPLCTFSFCGDVEFKVLALDESTIVGRISKQWSGLLREVFTDADFFGVTFPMDLDVKMKAVMMAACFLIDFMFFDKQNNQENDGFGMC